MIRMLFNNQKSKLYYKIKTIEELDQKNQILNPSQSILIILMNKMNNNNKQIHILQQNKMSLLIEKLKQ